MTRSYTDLAFRTCAILGGILLILGIASVLFNAEPSSGPDPLGIAFLAAGAGTNEAVRSVALVGDGRILIGGDFSSCNSVTRDRLARLWPGD